MNVIEYSVVVPVYNSSQSLFELSKRIKHVFEDVIKKKYELIFINDSPFIDKTVDALDEIANHDTNVIVIELMKNFGQQAATLCGIEHANGKYVITMDDDLQHEPRDIELLIQEQEHDVVIARFKDKKHSLFKRVTSDIKGYFDHLVLGKPRQIKLSPFRLINIKVAKMMLLRKTPFPFIPALLFFITEDIVNVDIEHHVRMDGKSNYTLRQMIKIFSNLMINNSSFLLRAIGYLGISISIVSVITSILLILKKLFFAYSVPGWTSIILSVLFFGGMILFSLGVMGEYLIRIIATAEQRQNYFVRRIQKCERYKTE